MNPKSIRPLLIPLLATWAASSAQAVLIVSEDFNYTIGTTLTDTDGAGTDANGGTGFAGPWNTARRDPIVAGLTDVRSASAGGGTGGAVLVAGNFSGRVWDGSAYGTDNGVVWFSILMSTTGEAFDGGFRSRMLMFGSLTSGSGFGFELRTSGTLVSRLGGVNGTTATYVPDQANFVLGRYVNSAAGNDVLQLWVNPTVEELAAFEASGVLADLGSVDSEISVFNATVNFAANSGLYLRSDNTVTSNWTADELRVGTTFLDVASGASTEPVTAYAQWQSTTGLGIGASDTEDPDGDGVQNLLEYAFNTDPLAASLATSQTQVVDSKLQVTFLRAREELTYEILGSSDLVTWTTLATNPGTVSTTVPVTFIDDVDLGTATPARRFLRVVVTLPE
jgi:hypothetical protein